MRALDALPVDFYARDTLTVARDLLGRVLYCHTAEGPAAGVIVETEAYPSGDAASHAFRGRTARNAVMFGPPGRAYIYFIYGKHFCFNAVTGAEGVGEAVLVRALEPVEGLELMSRRRALPAEAAALTNGPGKLCQALGITGALNGASLQVPPLVITRGPLPYASYTPVAAARVGISRETSKPYRFYLAESRYVSRRAVVASDNH